jgi:hypothetical protein
MIIRFIHNKIFSNTSLKKIILFKYIPYFSVGIILNLNCSVCIKILVIYVNKVELPFLKETVCKSKNKKLDNSVFYILFHGSLFKMLDRKARTP